MDGFLNISTLWAFHNVLVFLIISCSLLLLIQLFVLLLCRNEEPIFDIFQLQLLSLEVLREALYPSYCHTYVRFNNMGLGYQRRKMGVELLFMKIQMHRFTTQ